MSYQSRRVAHIPPYIYAGINKKKVELAQAGVDIIDLGIGDPDLPTPQHIVKKLIEEMDNTDNFKYSPYSGCIEFREAVANYYKKRYGVALDPETEVLTLIGSKEGLANIVTAAVDPGDYVLVPDPGYGVYRTATQLAGGRIHNMVLTKENGYRPDFKRIPESILSQSQLMFLNYPGNPTAATVDLAFFEDVIQFSKRHNVPVAHDFAYNNITFDGYAAPSILQVAGAKEIAVEFGSLSKTYNMTGWRIGYVVGNRDLIEALTVVKSNTDSSQFLPIQKAAAFALRSDQTCVEKDNQIYQERMKEVVSALDAIGIHVEPPRGSFFIWAEVPGNCTSGEFAETILEQTGVVVTPGTAFGPSGEGYFRMSLCVSTERLREAMRRLEDYLNEKRSSFDNG